MTIIEMTREIEHSTKALFLDDYAAMFDISDNEAQRIAEKSASYVEFLEIWENENWWQDI
jgi:hypothetical protein